MATTLEILSEIHRAEDELSAIGRRAEALLERVAGLYRWLKRESAGAPAPQVAVRFPVDANLPDVATALKSAGYVLAPSRGGFVARRMPVSATGLARLGGGLQ